MLVKRYIVKEMPEAVAMIRQDLGKDAVILSTKKIQSRGFLGLFSKTQIEVIAAANEQEPKADRPVSRDVSRNAALGAYQQTKVQPTQPASAPASKPAAQPAGTTLTAVAQSPQAGATSTAAQPASAATATMIAPQPASVQQSTVQPATFPVVTRQQENGIAQQPMVPTVRISGHNDTQGATVVPTNVANPVSNYVSSAEMNSSNVMSAFSSTLENLSQKADDQILKEVQELRSLIRSFINKAPNSMYPESVLQVRRELLENDVEENIVDELIERGIRHFQQVQEINEQEFRGILTNFIKEELDKEFQPSQLAPTTRIAAFIGPTGVGKTTTIAKLAAEQVLTRGKKVGLITTDTYRIAAVEQLRTYANILNVPLEVCYSQEDASKAMEKFADRDLILVDTAGRNYNNNLLNVKELNSYLQVLTPDETYLVLSLTTKATDLMKIVSTFDQVAIDKFLFTKADETSTYGAIYNLINRYKIPLSYITTGQNVPDDIEVVSTGRIASLLVGEKSYV